MKGEAIINAVTQVTKKWTKTRKAEEREKARTWRRREILTRSYRETIKDVARRVMEAAYFKASANGTLPAHARQIMYAARGEIQERTGRRLDDQYFCQTLLPDYINANSEAAAWDVVFDARGHFTEPHTERTVPLGTLDVRQYLYEVQNHAVDSPTLTVPGRTDFPTCGPDHRFSAILFIEKEGFMPLFKAVHLAERYDLAIMSTKGLSVTASRRLVDELCGESGIRLLVLHDFDKAGFSILGTFQRDTRRYEFENYVEVIDLGLRLADVQAYNLAAESVSYGKLDPKRNLRENGATQDEIQFLCGHSTYSGYSGQRVELNAFPSDQLVAWIEGKLQEHGVRKVVPTGDDLEEAYRRSITVAALEAVVGAIEEKALEKATTVEIPTGLEATIRENLEQNRTRPWDEVLAEIAREYVEDEDRDELHRLQRIEEVARLGQLGKKFSQRRTDGRKRRRT